MVQGKDLQLCVRQGKTYALKIDNAGTHESAIERELLHQRLGHLNYKSMEDMIRNEAVRGVSLSGVRPETCEH